MTRVFFKEHVAYHQSNRSRPTRYPAGSWFDVDDKRLSDIRRANPHAVETEDEHAARVKREAEKPTPAAAPARSVREREVITTTTTAPAKRKAIPTKIHTVDAAPRKRGAPAAPETTVLAADVRQPDSKPPVEDAAHEEVSDGEDGTDGHDAAAG